MSLKTINHTGKKGKHKSVSLYKTTYIMYVYNKKRKAETFVAVVGNRYDIKDMLRFRRCATKVVTSSDVQIRNKLKTCYRLYLSIALFYTL